MTLKAYRLLLAGILPCLCMLPGCVNTRQTELQEVIDDGVYLFERGQYDGARQTFLYALEKDPTNADLCYNAGQCYDRLGDWEAADNYYMRCLNLDANHAECRYALAVLMYQTKRKAEANRMIEEWLGSEPELAAPYTLDGWRYRQEGNLPNAISRLHEAYAKDPKNVRTLTELGIVYEQMDHPERALVLYERALKQNPGQPELVDRINFLRSKHTGPPLPGY